MPFFLLLVFFVNFFLVIAFSCLLPLFFHVTLFSVTFVLAIAVLELFCRFFVCYSFLLISYFFFLVNYVCFFYVTLFSVTFLFFAFLLFYCRCFFHFPLFFVTFFLFIFLVHYRCFFHVAVNTLSVLQSFRYPRESCLREKSCLESLCSLITISKTIETISWILQSVCPVKNVKILSINLLNF